MITIVERMQPVRKVVGAFLPGSCGQILGAQGHPGAVLLRQFHRIFRVIQGADRHAPDLRVDITGLSIGEVEHPA